MQMQHVSSSPSAFHDSTELYLIILQQSRRHSS
jgi:hypothetical protein